MLFTEEQKAALGEKGRAALDHITDTKFVNFLAAAYDTPSDIREMLITRYDSVEERNFMLLLLCFGAYLDASEKRMVLPTPGLVMELVAKMDAFLADAVKQTFWR